MLVMINDAINKSARVAVPATLIRWLQPKRKAVVRLPNGKEIVRKFPRDTVTQEAQDNYEQNKVIVPGQESWTMPEGYNK